MVEEFDEEELKRLLVTTGGRNQMERDELLDLAERERGLAESPARPDLHKDLRDLTSQVQMMSDSLTACKKMSKYRPLRNAYDVVAPQPQPTPRTFPEEKKPSREDKDPTREEDKDLILSCATSSNNNLRERLEAAFSDSSVRDRSDWGHRKRRFDYRKHPKRNFKPRVYKSGELNIELLVDLIQKELMTLVQLAPSLALIANVLYEAVVKYTECTRCSSRISSSLPCILTRIQDLILCVATKRQTDGKNRFHPAGRTVEKTKKEEEELVATDLDLPPEEPPKEPPEKVSKNLKEEFSERFLEKLLEKPPEKPSEKLSERYLEKLLDTPVEKLLGRSSEKSAEGPSEGLQEKAGEKQPTVIARSERIAVAACTEAVPGVQIRLGLKLLKWRKRLWEKSERVKLRRQSGKYPVVQLNESLAAPVVHLLKSQQQKEPSEERKQQVHYLKEYHARAGVVFTFDASVPVLGWVLAPGGCLTHLRKARATTYPRPETPLQEQKVLLKKNSLRVIDLRTGEKPVKFSTKAQQTPWPEWNSIGGKLSNERKSFTLEKYLANAPEIVRDLLREAEEEKMEIKKQEEEIDRLKNVMQEVHRRQIELSKLLLEKGIYSQTLIKLTDPNMLEKENNGLRELEDCMTGTSVCTVDSVKKKIQDLMERCNLKKKLVLTLIKYLNSNVPHEWFEEIMSFTMDDQKLTLEMLETKFNDLIQNSVSILPNDGVKAQRTSLQSEDQPSEGSRFVGAKLKEGPIFFSLFGWETGKAKAGAFGLGFDGFLPRWEIPWRIWTLPVLNDANEVNAAIRRLENRIYLLDMENKRLWQETQELRDLVASSIRKLNERNIFVSTGQSTETIKTADKTIHLTIQIESEKAAGPSRTSDVLEIEEDELFETRPKFLLKSSANPSNCGKPRMFPGNRTQGFNQSVGHMTMTSQHSQHYLKQGNECHQAGPSWRRLENPPEKPPPLQGMPNNERQLQTIMENDLDDSFTSIGQMIQMLRTRVKAIHKEVSVLKLKNDRIEKMLDKLVQAAAFSKNSSEDLETSFKNHLD